MKNTQGAYPLDVSTLLSLLAQRDQELARRNHDVAQRDDQLRMKDAQLAELSRRLQHLYEALRSMRSQRFGRSSEVTPHDQFSLCLNEAEIVVTIDEAAASTESDSIPDRREKRRRAGSVTLPPQTPVETIIHDLPESQKVCPDDGHALHRIGEEVSEQLDIQPAKVTIVRHVRPKYGCRCCQQGVHIAPLPPQPLPGCLATANTAALITVNKYVDHQPLYRQCETLTRSGVQITRATLAYWLIDLAELCQPLINLLIDTLHSARWMQLDETPVQVLREDGRPATSRSWMWVRRTVIDGKTIILFHYDPSRGASVVKTLLEGFTGTYLQHDGYAAYEADDADAKRPPVIEGEIDLDHAGGGRFTHVGCFAHARRKFVEVLKTLPPNKHKGTLAHEAITLIDKLYRIEAKLKDAPPDERYRRRQQESKPVLDELARWWEHKAPAAVPSAKIGKALLYLQRQWPKLIRYCDEGELNIDNNPIENAIRPFALGRKNWLFATSPKGAQASAIHYSLIATAQANGHDPYHYLRTVYNQLPKAKTVEDIERLLPWHLDAQSLRIA